MANTKLKEIGAQVNLGKILASTISTVTFSVLQMIFCFFLAENYLIRHLTSTA